MSLVFLAITCHSQSLETRPPAQKKTHAFTLGRPPYKKNEDACLKFSKESLRDTKILLCGHSLKFCSPVRNTKILFHGCGLKFFSPLKGTNNLFYNYNISCHIFIWPNTLKDTTKAPTVELFELKHPERFYYPLKI